MMKTIGITGGTGFVGSHLSALLRQQGHNVVIFTTRATPPPSRPGISYCHWQPEKGTIDTAALKDLDTVVHLGGAGIADKRWTPARKKEIVSSRVDGTRFLVAQLKQHAPRCKTLIAASATGYYGADTAGSAPFTEDAAPAHDFLGETCRRWEIESHAAESNFRTVILRLGIVLGKESGAFAEFAKPMSFGIMPILGSGRQVVSWIEITDLVRLIVFAADNGQMSGTFNAVALHPVTHKTLMKTIAAALGGIKIPAPAPAFIIRLLFGEMGGEVLKSATVSAQKTLTTGFTFTHPEITGAVKAILHKK